MSKLARKISRGEADIFMTFRNSRELASTGEHGDEIISGLIVTVFQDVGPTVEYNRSILSEEQAFNLSVKGLTALGDSKEKEIYGPLPVQNRDDLQALAFLMSIKAKDTQDDRIEEYGRPVAFWLIFHSSKKRLVLHASGLVQSYLTMLIQGLENEEQLTKEKLDHIYDRLTSIVSQANIRVYGYIDGKVMEFSDDSLIPLSPVIIIADHRTKNLQVLMLPDQHLSPMDRRNINIAINNLNKEKFKYGMTICTIDDPEEIRKILNYYKIEAVRLKT